MDLVKNIVPEQKKGSETGATARYECSSRHNAILLFNQAKLRLLDINNWYLVSGKKGAEFQLTDASGVPLDASIPKTGNLIRIKLPAPGNSEGDGFDWVRIEKFESAKNQLTDEELYGFRVRPVKNPVGESAESAHFYTSDASSTFLVHRKSCIVRAMERGKNEVPNPAGSFLNKVRNIFVAIPAMLGLSKPQWQNLVDGILAYPNQLL